MGPDSSTGPAPDATDPGPPAAETPYTMVVCDTDRATLSQLEWSAEAAGFEIVAECTNGPNALEVCRMVQPDVLVLAVEIPGVSTWDVLAELPHRSPETEVLLLSFDHEIRDEARHMGLFGGICRHNLGVDLDGALGRLADYLDRPGRASHDRRSGHDRRHHQDWLAVTSQRRSGNDRRRDDQGPPPTRA